ncbi:KR-domain-containing protein [Aspergillus brunneoviolaceus CBS 621.78]|uniref:KR-domain-containing protein n=1 Tax=Aspergillus brunneoviolaceus CBS 621.78 TaxID=1450534 RepID=A0ACD1G650_9EURO|nr:KR-domain-containing protein [Aspergillus brunneoviolaceus CBS 621.78]RAH44629.1 KR-domain-containing protein [Aspergillus brunneoviolaceus CBS 621.78]
MSRFDPFTLIDLCYRMVDNHALEATLFIPTNLLSRSRFDKNKNNKNKNTNNNNNNRRRCPVLIQFHGGSFLMGHRRYEPWFAQWFLDLARTHEMIIIRPDYRLLPESSVTDILEDIDHFWRWMQQDLSSLMADEYTKSGLFPDLSRVLCCGESSGGCLAVYSALELGSILSTEDKSEGTKISIRANVHGNEASTAQTGGGRDQETIRGILRASASNADGRTPGFSAPSAAAHEAAIREAYSVAGLDFSQTAMVEAHGTGTATGDPIEANAIAKCFGGAGVYLGAVRDFIRNSNSECDLLKTDPGAVISLEHKTIIPNIKFHTPNSAIPWEEAKLVVPVKPCPWPKDRAERNSVNSFGIAAVRAYAGTLPELDPDGICVHGAGSAMIVLIRAEYSQPICTALQIALVDLLAFWGVRPSAVIGHSSGEIAASYASGALTKSEAMTIAFYRGHVCKDAPQKGGMAAVGLGKTQVAQFLLPGVSIACENSPSGVTLAGDIDILDKDVLMAMGVVDGGLPNIALGKEGAGYVTKVGAVVSHLQIGDRVLYLNNTTSSLATETQTLGRITARIPDTLSFEDAATMPAVYVTVLIALVDKARLENGQSILIHAAAGGIGTAAITVARWLGLEIYCTVGSEPKAAFLVREHGIPRDRIFHSRNASFQDDIMVATNGIGVDCVLKSLSGELLHASWECVAACGCMVEIGKRDMLGRGQLALDRFEDNRAYIGIDLALSVVAAPAQVSRQMKRMLDLYADGHIRPIHPVTFYDAHDVQEALRYMQTGSHIGKVVIRTSENTNRALQWRPETPKPSFRQDRAYLLVGGMGGLGKAIATWMVTHGAKHLIFLSRSVGASEDDQAFIHELRLRGCAVQAVAGDVANFDTVQNVIDQALVPIAGVMQMAMVLCDVGILDMTVDDYRTPLRLKVEDTWSLHRALGPSNADLDFFVLFSSVGCQVGYWGQANYAAANTFLDAFVQYRHAQGLPASRQDIGAINDVGFISHNPAVGSAMEAGSARLFTEQDFLDTLQLTIARSSARPPCDGRPPGTAAGLGRVFHNPSQESQVMESRLPITHPDNHIIWKRDPRMAIYRNIETVAAQGEDATGGGGSSSSSRSMLKSFIAEVSTDPARLQQPAAAEFLAGELRDRVADFLMRKAEDGAEPLNLGMSLTEVGVDSLVAIELRNWWKQNLAVGVTALELEEWGQYIGVEGVGGEEAAGEGVWQWAKIRDACQGIIEVRQFQRTGLCLEFPPMNLIYLCIYAIPIRAPTIFCPIS